MNLSILGGWSLKARVTLFTLAIFLVGIWSLAFFAIGILRDDMQRQLGEQQFSTVSLLAASINEQLGDRLKALAAGAGGIAPAILENRATLQILLEQSTFLERLFNGGTIALGLDGTAIAEVPLLAGRIGVNYADRENIAAALKEGKSSIGRPVKGKKLPAPVFSMAVPIRDAQERVIGALAGTTDLSKPNFLDKVTESKYGKSGGYVLIAPQHGLIVTATDKSLIMQPIPAPGINPLFDRYVQGFEGYGSTVDSRGIEVFSAAKQIPVAGWLLVGRIPAEEVFAPISAMWRRVLLATIIFTLLAGCLTWWMTWHMLRRQLSPMLAAAKALNAMTDTTQTPQPLPITSSDEIGELIGGFNRLLEVLRQRDEQVRQLAFFDMLTNLPNRRLLSDRLTQTMAAIKRSGCYGALMFLDLDNFKMLNDTHGHEVGDLLLIEAADRLKSCVREMDTVARFGGDEFVVMISELGVEKSASTAQAGIIADKIRVALAKPYVFKIQHEEKAETIAEHNCTASIGVVLFSKHDVSQDDILRWADTAMYQAKEAGCNLIRFYESKV